jgi:AcrR family transcriptional regulator
MQRDITKNIIKDSFLKILNSSKDIDKITVSNIIKEAKISRQTFYYHFQDIYDLREWIIKTDFEEMIEKSIECETYKDALEYIFVCINKQKILINKSLQSSKREFIEEIIFNNIRKYLCNFQMIQEVGYEIATEDHDFIIEFYCCAITGICIRVMSEQETQIRIKDLIDKIDRLVAGKMISIK